MLHKVDLSTRQITVSLTRPARQGATLTDAYGNPVGHCAESRDTEAVFGHR